MHVLSQRHVGLSRRLIFSTPFRHFEHMDMPEPWVILIFVELFWSKSLSHFAEKAWVVSCHQDFTVPWVNFPIISQKYAGKFSYFPQKLELFSKPWVILAQKSLSYFWNVEKISLPARQSSLISRPPSFPILHLKLESRAQLWNFTTLCIGKIALLTLSLWISWFVYCKDWRLRF